jgi:hypothetical protein
LCSGAAIAALIAVWPAATVAETASAGQSRAARRVHERQDEARRLELDALRSLTDSAMGNRALPADFTISWRNDFLKAQPGTLVPFTVTIESSSGHTEAWMNLRVAKRGQAAAPAPSRTPIVYPFEAVFPIDLTNGPTRITRGFTVPAGEYDVYVALRERSGVEGQPRARAAVLKQPISVPDFWAGELAASSVLLADRIDSLARPIDAAEMFERPYVVGDNDIQVAAEPVFRKDRELVVVFLIYDPLMTSDGNFDVKVDYHLYRRSSGAVEGSNGEHPAARPGERYVSRTDPQRLSRSNAGARLDLSAGRSLMAGQGILLSSFDEGEYRLGITVTDVLSHRTLSRDVSFTVVGS